MKQREIIELKIDSLAFGGAGVARNEGTVYFVKNSAPGDHAKVMITQRKKKHKEGVVDSIISPSPFRVKPPCPYFGNCGGCSWQHIDYAEQVNQKKQIVLDSIVRIGKLDPKHIGEPMPSPMEFNYRNKMEFSFSASRWLSKDEIDKADEITNKNFAFGLHAPGRFDKAIDIESCMLQCERANQAFKVIREKSIKSGASAYNHVKHEGFFRGFLLRYSQANDQLMAMIITNTVKSKKEIEFMDYYKKEFVKLFNDRDTVLHAVSATNSPVNLDSIDLISGSGFIYEKILDIEYRISPQSFFQTNSSHLNGFISKIVECAEIAENDVVWDLYCGAGSITLPASRKCAEIYGFELVESAISDAKENAERNNINNAKFYCEDLHKKHIPELLNSMPKPDVVIVDPPRAGMHPNLVEHLAEIAPKRIVYVSCNPTTQARDLEMLKDKYQITELIPVDLFPHTYHVESICRLDKIEA
jgi:23S rRNA (uracil1939-C5)-methyltransferase